MPPEPHRAAADLVPLLISRKLTLATAEATTGGLIGHCLVAVPGSSAVFRGGCAPYSNAAKLRLGAPADILATNGAVSAEAAQALAQATRAWFGADVAIAETGIAGPTGGSEGRPVGTFWIAVAFGDEATSRRFVFGTDRRENQEAAAEAAMNLALEVLSPASGG